MFIKRGCNNISTLTIQSGHNGCIGRICQIVNGRRFDIIHFGIGISNIINCCGFVGTVVAIEISTVEIVLQNGLVESPFVCNDTRQEAHEFVAAVSIRNIINITTIDESARGGYNHKDLRKEHKIKHKEEKEECGIYFKYPVGFLLVLLLTIIVVVVVIVVIVVVVGGNTIDTDAITCIHVVFVFAFVKKRPQCGDC